MVHLLPHPLSNVLTGSAIDRRRHWYVFRALNLYRLSVASLTLGVFLLDEDARFFGTKDPNLFVWVASSYIGIILLSICASFWRRPDLKLQTHSLALVDLIALSLLIYASGGVDSNVTLLLAMAIAANGILLPLFANLMVAATAFFILLGEWLLVAWEVFQQTSGLPVKGDPLLLFFEQFQPSIDELSRIGLLGATFFVVALTTYTLAERARRSEELARQKSHELLEIAELNRAIVEHLHSGIIVVDAFGRVRLINDTARDFLNYHDTAMHIPVNDLCRPLSQRLTSWLSAGVPSSKPFRPDEHLPDITASFSHLGSNGESGDTLIFLEDSTQLSQRLQQIKLAALGRLTAGIAHEIRNPLASISHAAQLLHESDSTSTSDKRLSQIVYENAKRANAIIANVLDLSRRDRSKPEDIALRPWLEAFGKEFLRAHGDDKPKIRLKVTPSDLSARFDTGQLHQVLWNLCNNACLHGSRPGQTPEIQLIAATDPIRERPILDVIDNGPGIAETEGKKIFEPFFTTKTQGTGLGLYISREMCEANRAQLQYIRPTEGGCCFRITFTPITKHEKRSQWISATP